MTQVESQENVPECIKLRRPPPDSDVHWGAISAEPASPRNVRCTQGELIVRINSSTIGRDGLKITNGLMRRKTDAEEIITVRALCPRPQRRCGSGGDSYYKVSATDLGGIVDDYAASTATTGVVAVNGSTAGNIETTGETFGTGFPSV